MCVVCVLFVCLCVFCVCLCVFGSFVFCCISWFECVLFSQWFVLVFVCVCVCVCLADCGVVFLIVLFVCLCAIVFVMCF